MCCALLSSIRPHVSIFSNGYLFFWLLCLCMRQNDCLSLNLFPGDNGKARGGRSKTGLGSLSIMNYVPINWEFSSKWKDRYPLANFRAKFGPRDSWLSDQAPSRYPTRSERSVLSLIEKIYLSFPKKQKRKWINGDRHLRPSLFLFPSHIQWKWRFTWSAHLPADKIIQINPPYFPKDRNRPDITIPRHPSLQTHLLAISSHTQGN